MKRKLLSIMLCIMLLSSVTIPAFATDYPESDFVCNWQIYNYKDSDKLYLASQVRGYVYSNATKQFVSCDAKLNIYINKDDIFLECVEGDGTKKKNNTDKDFSGNVTLTLTKMNIQEVTCVALNPAGSNLSFLTETTNLNGLTMTPRQLVINELNQDGTVEVWTRQKTWNGQTDMIVGFILNSTNNQFAKLYMDATGQKWNKSQASTPTATPKPTSKPTATPKPTQKPTSTSSTKQNSEYLSVQFVVSFAQNAFFSLYDVDMYLDGKYIANLTQGKIKYIDVDNITKGKHEIVFYKSNGKSVNGSFTATITHNSVIKCKLHAYNNYVDVDDMEMYGLYSNGELLQASMSPLTAMSPNESPYSLNYEISFVENAYFSKYDVDMYVDDQYVTTLVQGYKTNDTYSLPFGGTHTITFYKAGGHSVYGAVQIYVVKESTYFKCRINATSSEIGISNITTNAGEV